MAAFLFHHKGPGQMCATHLPGANVSMSLTSGLTRITRFIQLFPRSLYRGCHNRRLIESKLINQQSSHHYDSFFLISPQRPRANARNTFARGKRVEMPCQRFNKKTFVDDWGSDCFVLGNDAPCFTAVCHRIRPDALQKKGRKQLKQGVFCLFLCGKCYTLPGVCLHFCKKGKFSQIYC